MFSKGIDLLIKGVLISCFAVLVGCAGENIEFATPAQVGFQGKFTCFDTAEETFARYFAGELKSDEVSQFWDCMDFAILQFVKIVKGKEDSTYTADEIARFLDEFFLKGRNLRDQKEFLKEMMYIKRLFVGGSLEFVTHHDLMHRTREVIATFKTVTIDLNEHMHVLSRGLTQSGLKSGLDLAQVKAAEVALRRGAAQIGELVLNRQNPYSFTRFMALLIELEKVIQDGKPGFSFELTKKFLPLFSEMKGLLVGPPANDIQVTDWPRFFGVVSTFVGWGLKYKLMVDERDWSQGQALEALETLGNEAFDLLAEGALNQPGKLFAYSDLEKLVAELNSLELLPLNLDNDSFNSLLRPLAEKLLAPGGKGGLDGADIQVARSELNRWFEGQRFINDLLSGVAPEERLLSSGAREMALVAERSLSFQIDSLGRLIFPAPQASLDRDSLISLNWQKTLIRVLMRGYGSPQSFDQVPALSEAQLVALAEDWQPLGVTLGLFEAGAAARAAKKILMESNLFVPSSNGNQVIDFLEGVHYLAYAVSGLNSASEIFSGLELRCGDSQGFLGAACYRSVMAGEFRQWLPQLENLTSFLAESPSQWGRVTELLESTLRTDGYSDAPISKGELAEMMVLVQFVENFFARFDFEGSATINVTESLNAYPIFEQSLTILVRDSLGIDLSRNNIRALFTFLFRYGKPPQSTFGGAVKFLNWRWSEETWRYEADRIRILQILSELNALR